MLAAISSRLVGFLDFFFESFLAPAMVRVARHTRSALGGGGFVGGGQLDQRRGVGFTVWWSRRALAFERRGSMPDDRAEWASAGRGASASANDGWGRRPEK